MNEFVITARYDGGPLANHPDTVSSRAQARVSIRVLKQFLKRGNSGGHLKVIGEPMPISSIMTADESNQCLLRVICRGPPEEVTEQGTVPPSDFIVGEIPDPVSRAFIGNDRFPCLSNYLLFK